MSTAAHAVHQVIIVGSGPAGYTAAVYAARAGLEPIVFAGAITAGGALMNTTDVENFPGFPDGVLGPELMEKMEAQADRFGADVRFEDVVAVDLAGPIKTVFKDTDILVVGGGDSAMEEALFLTRFGRTVTVVHRRDELRASKIMADRALASDKITFAWNSEIAAIHGEQKVTGATLRDTVTGQTRQVEAAGIFVAIGHLPRTELIAGTVDLDEAGQPDPGASQTPQDSVLV